MQLAVQPLSGNGSILVASWMPSPSLLISLHMAGSGGNGGWTFSRRAGSQQSCCERLTSERLGMSAERVGRMGFTWLSWAFPGGLRQLTQARTTLMFQRWPEMLCGYWIKWSRVWRFWRSVRLMMTSLPVLLNSVYLFFGYMHYPDISLQIEELTWNYIGHWIFPFPFCLYNFLGLASTIQWALGTDVIW